MEFIEQCEYNHEYNFELNDLYLSSDSITERMSIECNPDDNQLYTEFDTNNPMELDDYDETSEELFQSDYLIGYEYEETLDITNQIANINLVSKNNLSNQMEAD
jgi:hypothetical protein